MLKKLMAQLKRGMQPVIPDVSKFNDSIASQVSWNPAKRGGTNFKTHNLVEIGPGRIEFKSSNFAKVFSLIFILVGMGLMLFYFLNLYQDWTDIDADIILAIVGLIFFIIGMSLLVWYSRAIVFDKGLGYYWKGKKAPDHTIEYIQPELFVHLNEIHALQIISEFVRHDKSSFYSYELNLVLKDGDRKNVIDHGNLKFIRQDAEKLSQFLNVPIWDSTS